MPKSTCTVDDCERDGIARSLCAKHYDRWRRVGDVIAGPRVRGRAGRTWVEIFDEAPKEVMPNGCIEWRGTLSPYNYGIVQSKKYGATGAHRVALAQKLGGFIPEGMQACHACDNPPCVNPDHLFAGTDKANTDDMIAKRRHSYGERHTAKLTEAQVREILTRYAAGGIGRPELAREYGVSPACIQKITERKTWRHLDGIAA